MLLVASLQLLGRHSGSVHTIRQAEVSRVFIYRAVPSIPTLLLLLSDGFLILSPDSLPWAGPPRETPSGRSHCKK